MTTIINNARKTFKRRMKRELDLENPVTMSEKLQWLKVYDQHINQVICCDKHTAKNFIKEIVGQQYIIPTVDTSIYPVVLKANHNSSGAFIVKNRQEEKNSINIINSLLKRKYGYNKGEWAYYYIKPRMIRENVIDTNNIDYKFHCSNGEVNFIQTVFGITGSDTKETVYDTNKKDTGYHINYKNKLESNTFPTSQKNLDHMIEVAKEISKLWKYVRVDLYANDNNIYFGEVTFWPLSGCIETKDDAILGNIIDVDLNTKSEITFDDNFHIDLDKLYQKYS